MWFLSESPCANIIFSSMTGIPNSQSLLRNTSFLSQRLY
nr:MAG TPA: hypothetical protein [Caudoviricetes sp.]